ncbi:MAG: barstar family protein, partial [Clostridia bacterium]|nr:barstar family protein [Clostridia bacterium]
DFYMNMTIDTSRHNCLACHIDGHFTFVFTYSRKAAFANSDIAFFELICADYGSKAEIISLKHKIMEKYPHVYQKISDAYIEKLKRDIPHNEIIEILEENDKQAERIVIDLSIVENEKQLLVAIKFSLHMPKNFGTNWNSLYDIGEAFLPKRLVFLEYGDFKKRQTEAAANLIQWFSKIDIGECIFDFL